MDFAFINDDFKTYFILRRAIKVVHASINKVKVFIQAD